MVHKPSWFKDGQVWVSWAETIGINSHGHDLYVLDPSTGNRTQVIDDKVHADIVGLITGHNTSTSGWMYASQLVDAPPAVPVYFDQRSVDAFDDFMLLPEMEGFGIASLGDLIDHGHVVARAGHGSPSSDQRRGSIPYIKVSDLRAGQVNINPTNRVTQMEAERHWGQASSGLSEFDLLTPIRTSKNIGDFCVLMPGQEQVVLTKEILVLHAADDAPFDNFYLLWAMTLNVVRRQWDRIVFMQTNREDVGLRFREIVIPIPTDAARAMEVSSAFRDYYTGLVQLRTNLIDFLAKDEQHHVFLSADAGEGEADEASEEDSGDDQAEE